MRKVAVVSVGRSDYGIYRPVLQAMRESNTLEPTVIVGGAHLASRYGGTIDEIESDGFFIGAKVQMLLGSDEPEAVAKSMGLGTIGFAQAFEQLKPHLVLVLGDRFEMMSASLAAVPFRLPLAHIHGGELTLGAIDDSIRHAITKLSHLHFPSTAPYADRIAQMGEEPWRIHTVGAPGLDGIKSFKPLSKSEFHECFGVKLPEEFLLVTYHPETLSDASREDFAALLGAIEACALAALFTMPNADSGGLAIREQLLGALPHKPSWFAVENLGSRGYYTAMSLARAMVGNSSSGIVEAASFKLPVVNIGSRQQGRIRGKNVLDVAPVRSDIERAIAKATSEHFRSGLKCLENVYGDGNAAARIVKVLQEVPLDQRLTKKLFVDQGAGPET